MKDCSELNKLRIEIDKADEVIVKAFAERMLLCDEIARVKQQNKIGVLYNNREAEVLEKCRSLVSEDLREDVTQLMQTIMSISKKRQKRIIVGE